MNQDSFRKLLQAPQAGSSSGNAASRGTISGAISGSKQKKVIEPSQPVFKPRKVKKEREQNYRDRAAERRTGESHDYAEVEALLEDFERRTANNEDKAAVEQQRRYLGGDGDHSILVKGLDMALLEQNKARVGLSTAAEDDSLEQAFLEVSSQATTQKKKTREDLIRELKEKRQKGKGEGESGGDTNKTTTAEQEARILEEVKKAGKFKPIGASADDRAKRKREKDKNGEKKKKKRKAEGTETRLDTDGRTKTHANMTPPPAKSTPQDKDPLKLPEEAGPEPIDDIFAGAGEYQGYNLGDEDEDREDDAQSDEMHQDGEHAESSDNHPAVRRWIDIEESKKSEPNLSSVKDVQPSSRTTTSQPERTSQEDMEETNQVPTRLVPLLSSALPDIKDFLAMEEAAEAMEKRKKRKEKRKGGKGDEQGEKKKLSAEAKVERDFKKLKSYTEKKTGS